MTRPNTILLKGPQQKEEYAAADATIKPGHLIELTSSGTVQRHTTAGGNGERLFATEDALQGNGITVAYGSGDLVTCDLAPPGATRLARLAAAAAAVVIGDKLISAGDGTLKKAVPAGGSVLYANTAASTAVSNGVSTEQFFDLSYSVPAGTLKVGDVLEIEGLAVVSAAAGTDTGTVKLYIGGVTIVTTAALDLTTADLVYFKGTVIVRTIGASGTIVAGGIDTIGPAASATLKPFSLASSTLDTTVANIIRASITYSATTATCTAALQLLTVRRMNTGGNVILAFAQEAVDNSAGVAETFLRVRVAA